MPFAPHEIENKKFVVGLRGYATHEVDAFLRAVAADYRALLASPPNRDGEWPAQMGGEIEGIMRNALEAAEKVRRDAEEEATEIRRAAEHYLNEVSRRTEQLRLTESRLQQTYYSIQGETPVLLTIEQ